MLTLNDSAEKQPKSNNRVHLNGNCAPSVWARFVLAAPSSFMEGWGGEDGPVRVPSAHLSNSDSHCLKYVSSCTQILKQMDRGRGQINK